MAGALEGDIFIGPKAEEYRGLLHIKYPMEHGIVEDWSDMERVWQYIYSKEQLQTFSEEVKYKVLPVISLWFMNNVICLVKYFMLNY